MAVYVDNAKHRLRRGGRPILVLCHMMADTDDELEAMARRLELIPEWRHGDHYDVSKAKRDAAIASGAVEVAPAYLVALRRNRRPGGIAGSGEGRSTLADTGGGRPTAETAMPAGIAKNGDRGL